MRMKTLLFALAGLLLLASCQKPAPLPKWNDPLSTTFDASRKPFYHGVASGDPLTDRVIIWTRVTPDDSMARIPVKWEVAKDEQFSAVLKSDTLGTTPLRDYTVKVDVTGLEPGQHYFFRFSALGATSPVGRTKTLPTNAVDSLKLAVVSCSNWEFGYFNAYDRIADKEVDAVLHLGDYIYEYGVGKYGDTTIGRLHVPACLPARRASTRRSRNVYALPYCPVGNTRETVADSNSTPDMKGTRPTRSYPRPGRAGSTQAPRARLR